VRAGVCGVSWPLAFDQNGGRFDYAAIGTVTILASRLSAAAQPGQILINQRLHAAVEDSVRAVPTEPSL
jgi:class 3 adenylate cyclase